MNRSRALSFALLLGVLLVPAEVHAQQKPKDDKYTKEASKQLGVAMLRQEEAERAQAYQQALTALQEGMTKEADNPKIWFLAGQAYAGMMDFPGADSCFKKAEALYPEYAPEVEAEREVGWMNGFNAAVALMDEQKYPEALKLFEGSHELYPKRPEGLLNMGSIYANQGNTEKAVWAFEEAVKAVNSERFAELEPEAQAQWKGFEDMAKLNISQMLGQRGVEAFQAEKYDTAAVLFARAAESNPQSRDFLFNVVQAHFAQAQALEEKRDTTAEAGKAPEDAELVKMYQQLQPEIAKVQEFDPNNENLMLILARSKRRAGELSGNGQKGQQEALAALEQLQSMTLTVSELMVEPGEGTAKVSGTVKNNGVDAGAQVKLEVTLLGSDGSVIGTQETAVTAPEKDATTTFELTVADIQKQVAGWKYKVVSS
jgi:tetratricopeptide (TPR) repeat protein